ncbi:unnamed protein product [Ectocarpus sp. 6 AP-2014]
MFHPTGFFGKHNEQTHAPITSSRTTQGGGLTLLLLSQPWTGASHHFRQQHNGNIAGSLPNHPTDDCRLRNRSSLAVGVSISTQAGCCEETTCHATPDAPQSRHQHLPLGLTDPAPKNAQAEVGFGHVYRWLVVDDNASFQPSHNRYRQHCRADKMIPSSTHDPKQHGCPG